ncbi:probable disease resistance protein At4g27220 [Macadamia integrifolia]|uniref:probable disease resistance protein At4g27220 n=1 Tax=Macadamia integrifolia TaxID=60698 RepID=UPI001C4EE9FB|nr:probable disease resistance protein At4g27220 [Macadamia integrifolia]
MCPSFYFLSMKSEEMVEEIEKLLSEKKSFSFLSIPQPPLNPESIGIEFEEQSKMILDVSDGLEANPQLIPDGQGAKETESQTLDGSNTQSKPDVVGSGSGSDVDSESIVDGSDLELKHGSDRLDTKSKLTKGGSDTNFKLIMVGSGTKSKPITYGSDAESMTSDEWDLEPISGGDFMEFECRKSIMEEMMKGLKDKEINMIGVYGIGGVGKTTLVMEVGKRAKQGGMFEEVVMVPLSQHFDEREIQQKIGDALGLVELEALDTIGERGDVLSKRIKNKNQILIILDDVWDRFKPSKIGIPHGKKDHHEGCKLLFTTTSQKVCHDIMPRKSKIIHLDNLMQKDAWHLFRRNVGKFVYSPSCRDLAREVASECRGIPLALVTVGRALRGKDPSKWKGAAQELNASKFKTIEAKGIDATLFSCLKLGYDYLENEEIKQFFLLCCLFPEKFSIHITKLVIYGIGEGVFQSQHAETWPEVMKTVDGMVKKLKDSCFLFEGDVSGHVKMHDVVRRFTVLNHHRHIESMVRAGEGLKEWPMRVMASENYMRISLMCNDIHQLPNGLKYPLLRMLLLQQNHNVQEMSDDFFKELESLRVLDLSGCFPSLEALDQHFHSVSRSLLQPLKNLRTLCLDQYLRGPIPELGDLKNLEILTLSKSKFITELPRGIEQLNNLRLLDISFSRMETVLPKMFVNLSRLEVLDMRCSFRGWSSKTVQGSNASFLEVAFLPRLVALSVELPDAQHIPEKVNPPPKWNNFCIFIGSEQVRHLEFPEDLSSRVLILNTSINTFPAWFNKLVVERLEVLIYFECMMLKNFDEELHLSQDTSIENMRNLSIRDCDHIEYIINADEWLPKTKLAFHSLLKELHLHNLPRLGKICLGQLQNGFKLQVLEVEDCNGLTDFLLPSSTWKGSSQSVILCSLKTLIVRRCHNLRCIFPLSVVQGLLQLVYLFVEDCKVLQEIITKDKVKEGVMENTAIAPDMVFLPFFKSLRLENLYNLKNIIPNGIAFQTPSFDTLCMERCPDAEHFKINKGDEEETLQ